MVELNEKALEAAHHTYQTHEQMGHLKAQRLSDSCLTAVITAYLAALPEEVVFCPNCGWNSAMDGEALPASDDGLAAKLSLFADHLFPEVLEYGREIALLREAATAIQSKDEQIERLTRERDEALDRHSSAVMGEIEATQRTEAAEQQVQKLTAKNERLRGALRPFAEASETYDEFWATETDGQAHQDEEDAEMVTFFSLGSDINMVPLSAFRLARTTLQKEQADG